MKILIIAFSNSIHTARWINQITDNNWKIYLFPSNDNGIVHECINKVKVISPFIFLYGFRIYEPITLFFRYICRSINKEYLEKRLYKCIQRIKPDIIHTMETQHAGYLISSVKKKYFDYKPFPVWWHTNWGSDIYLFGRLEEHKQKIAATLKDIDYYSCECKRDVLLAESYGFKGTVLPVYPNAGGFNIRQLDELRRMTIAPSQRKVIMLKGYQGWAGRALVGLRAIARASDLLKGYTLVIYGSDGFDDVGIASELFMCETGVQVRLVENNTSHFDILKFHGTARISIGLSISDAISTSLLEAMAMGSFPIQSRTSAADEWIDDGENGLLVPPEDPDIIEIAIRKALLDDQLVDNAAQKNWQLICKRVDYDKLKDLTVNSYKTVYERKK